jgi:glyoxylase-like metal-dependent hydrolase (beta-lactamase superfamily II)
LAKGAPSYNPHDVDHLLSLENILWLDGDAGDIDEYIYFTHSGGHCPHHIVYLINAGDQKIFFGGDEAPQYKQIKTKYMAKYDFDGRKAMELREQYAIKGKAENWKFLFYHDVKKPIATIDF